MNQISLSACGQSASKEVLVRAIPEPGLVLPDGVCLGGEAIVTARAPLTSYQWQDQDGNELGTGASITLTSGRYRLLAADNNGCTIDTSFTIPERPSAIYQYFHAGFYHFLQ